MSHLFEIFTFAVSIIIMIGIIWRLYCIECKLNKIQRELRDIYRQAYAVNFLHEQMSTLIAKANEKEKS